MIKEIQETSYGKIPAQSYVDLIRTVKGLLEQHRCGYRALPPLLFPKDPVLQQEMLGLFEDMRAGVVRPKGDSQVPWQRK